ncbi:MAG: mechanosensitive ion channel domain-containing protein [Thiogranum sp.]
MNRMLRPVFMTFLILLGGLSAPLIAATAAGKAQTGGDAEIPVDELELKLRPLMRDQLKVEADAWLKMLEDKVSDISKADIAVKYKRKEIASAEQLEDAFVQLDEAKKNAEKPSADGETRMTVEEAERALEETKKEAKATVNKVKKDTEIQKIISLAAKKAKEKKKAEAAAGKAEEKPEPEKSQKDGQPKEGIDKTKEKIDAAVEERNRDRANLLDYLTELRDQQTALIDRTNVVIAAYETKGGPVEEVEVYRQYVAAVSGIAVDVSDMEATLKTIGGWLLADEGGLRWLKNIALFVTIVLVFMFLGRLLAKAVERVMAKSRQTSQLLGDFLVVSVRRLVLAIGVLIGLAALEINVGPLLAVIGAAGFVIAFALQNSLGNFASGILIMVFKPFDIGDLVEVGGILGKVHSMNLLSVLVHTPDNKAVIIPNNNVWSDSITNVTGTDTRRVDLIFGIGYDDDIEKAQAILEDVVSEHPLILKDPEPVISVHELADSSVNFVCRPWVKTDDYWEVYWDLTRSVKQRFDKQGVSIPFPQRDVHVYNALPQATAPELTKPESAGSSQLAQVKGDISKAGDTDLDEGG